MTAPLAFAVEPRPRAVWDIVLSIVFLVGNAVVYAAGAILALFMMAFTDYCPTGCDIDAGVGAVFAVASVITLVGLVTTVVTIVLLVRRRRAWWVALLGGVLSIVGWVLAIGLYGDAVAPG